jgi:hypothetical protein
MGDATVDSATDTGASPGDSTAPVDSGVASDSSGGDSTTSDSGDGGVDAGQGGDAADAGDVADASVEVNAPIPCDAATSCGDAMVCCTSTCVDLAHDPRNCGACGNACNAGTQFCTGTQCDNAVFTNICANLSITVVNDQYGLDNVAGASLGQAIAAACPDAGVIVSIVNQTKQGILVPMDGGWRPNTGVGTTLVAGGGAAGQLAVTYMDDTYAKSPVYLLNNGTTSSIYERSTGVPLVTVNDSMLTAQHDYFIMQLAVEPVSGTLCFFGEGILGPGTVAAGYFGSHVLVPNHASYPASWYVYEWVDDGNMVPDSNDTFNPVASGP